MADSQDQLAPFFSASSNDQSAVLVTVSIVAAAVSALAIAAKLFWRRNIYSLKAYDHALLIGATFLFAYTGLVVYSADLGVGKHREDVGDEHLVLIRKVQYAATLLWIVIGTCTKVSMCLFIESINTYNNIFKANRILIGAVGVLGLSTFLANCFRCSLPSPWLAESTESCPAATSIYQLTIGASIATDVLICVLAVPMICKVQIATKTKVFVIFLFSIRIACVVTALPAILDTTHLYNRQDIDYTWLSLSPAVWLAATANCFVITNCVPSLKGLFDSWLGNTLGIDIDAPYQLERMDGKNTFAAKAYETGCGGSGASGSGGGSGAHASSRPKDNSSAVGRRSGTFVGLRLGPAAQNEAACFSDNTGHHRTRSVSAEKGTSRRRDADRISDSDEENDAHESESVKRLTRGIVIQEEVEVRFDRPGKGRDPECDDRRSWSAST
ncbi:uncharacterized protein B0I36DRAFT_234415 [Microdochium trichocladiopsis]|uniref:Rhodopsin domain-containing protein n=1 Tax=Microdochium trichocladiopsis TaxID=1682393 RepID=A0A9P8YHQ0_9PEZI|nr:uncharacterized protein B0I36DRAFT_234415 [Microdochium trichocladiopsis]KAH7040594.1 hypothetical protein B0I36DRAFT_234415 [Microdochium trichocladiopsis]